VSDIDRLFLIGAQKEGGVFTLLPVSHENAMDVFWDYEGGVVKYPSQMQYSATPIRYGITAVPLEEKCHALVMVKVVGIRRDLRLEGEPYPWTRVSSALNLDTPAEHRESRRAIILG
jgi:hypothetical protein